MKAWEFAVPDGEALDFWIANAYEILNRHEGPGETFVDLGAHVGIVSVLAVREKGFQKVIAVEPALENYVQLLDNIAVNDCEGKILPVWAAITNDLPLTQTTLKQMPTGNSGTFSPAFTENYLGQQVMSLTLGNIYDIIGRPNFLKIDIEGSEWQILEQIDSDYLDIELHVKQGGSVEGAVKILDLKYNLTPNTLTDGFYGHRK